MFCLPSDVRSRVSIYFLSSPAWALRDSATSIVLNMVIFNSELRCLASEVKLSLADRNFRGLDATVMLSQELREWPGSTWKGKCGTCTILVTYEARVNWFASLWRSSPETMKKWLFPVKFWFPRCYQNISYVTCWKSNDRSQVIGVPW